MNKERIDSIVHGFHTCSKDGSINSLLDTLEDFNIDLTTENMVYAFDQYRLEHCNIEDFEELWSDYQYETAKQILEFTRYDREKAQKRALNYPAYFIYPECLHYFIGEIPNL